MCASFLALGIPPGITPPLTSVRHCPLQGPGCKPCFTTDDRRGVAGSDGAVESERGVGVIMRLFVFDGSSM